VTKAKRPSESKRPRRRAGQVIRNFFACPFCHAETTLRVVAYRFRTVRVECDICGSRFSFDAYQVANAMGEKAPRSILTHVAHDVAAAVTVGNMQANGSTPEQIRAMLAEHGVPDEDA